MSIADCAQPQDSNGERIAKVIARSGLCSRRDAEAWIEAGRVAVNGVVIQSAALDVGTSDKITVDGSPLPARDVPRLWRYHKPKGRVTTHKDPQGRPTVFEALPDHLPRLISVGRLDFNTEGLLLLTNDGDVARHMELPSTGWTRRYKVRAHGKIDQTGLDALKDGLTIGGVTYGAIEAKLEREQGDNVWVSLSIREGKNREVRRIMEHLGLGVNRLIRVSFGPFILGDLEPGAIEEVSARVLRDQLGPRLSKQFGVQRSPLDTMIRARPNYLRRRHEVVPERQEDEKIYKKRRILPMNAAEGEAKIEVKEIKPRKFGGQDRKGRDEGKKALFRDGTERKLRVSARESRERFKERNQHTAGGRSETTPNEKNNERREKSGFGAKSDFVRAPRRRTASSLTDFERKTERRTQRHEKVNDRSGPLNKSGPPSETRVKSLRPSSDDFRRKRDSNLDGNQSRPQKDRFKGGDSASAPGIKQKPRSENSAKPKHGDDKDRREPFVRSERHFKDGNGVKKARSENFVRDDTNAWPRQKPRDGRFRRDDKPESKPFRRDKLSREGGKHFGNHTRPQGRPGPRRMDRGKRVDPSENPETS